MAKNSVMQMKRFLCKKGRITIPFPMRACLGWSAGDVLSFTVQRDNSILISRVEPCRCDSTAEQREIADFVETLTPSQQMALLVHLSEAWAVRQEGRR